MSLTILGPRLFETDSLGRLMARLGTLFPRHRLLVTLPGIHASQRNAFLDHLRSRRAEAALPPLLPEEEEEELAVSVDLFFEPGEVMIRPDPANMALAYEADEVLQRVVPKRHIKFLFAFDPQVQDALRRRGEWWRISRLPRSPAEMRQLVEDSKVAIGEGTVYYGSRTSGTRYLTFQEFHQLAQLPADALARQLEEIARFGRYRNRFGNPEVAFFEADPTRFGIGNFDGMAWRDMPERDLRAAHAALVETFRSAVPPAFESDDARSEIWRNRMFTVLVNPPGDTSAEEILHGLGAEFFLQVEWLPGGRFDEGEFIFDTVFDEEPERSLGTPSPGLCDPKVKGFIFNFMREFGDLEHVNVGRIAHSLSKRRRAVGRREVYIAELKQRGASAAVVRFIRLLKWGIRERLDEGKDLLQAMLENEEYVDYILDRRLGCRQLGMNLPPRITIQRVGEIYDGPRTELRGQLLHTPYGERDYIRGIATDKLPSWKYARDGYALRFARLLGEAAAPNLVVGRTYEGGQRVVFDDGDELVIEDEHGLPSVLIAGDHSGAFDEYQQPLLHYAQDYARPANDRLTKVPDPKLFALAYVEAFEARLRQLQTEYQKRRRAFDTLFRHCRYDPAGSFAYRWECVLRRMDLTDPTAMAEAIRRHIVILGA